MAAKKDSTLENTTDREIVTTRLINAPREVVWQAFADPDQVLQWWGPHGFTNTSLQREFKVGGVWRFTMHGPDGQDYPNKIVFLEIVKNEKIVHQHSNDGDESEPISFVNTITFKDEDGKTRVTMTAVLPSAEMRNKVAQDHQAVEGGKQTLSRLDSFVKPFVIQRSFNAPREKIWKAWTDPKEMQQWFGPKGSTMPTAKMDFRVGGICHYSMKIEGGVELWGKLIYRAIEKPSRLEWVQSFSDKDGGLGVHPMAPNWPKYMLTIITLEENKGKTLLTVRWSAYDATEDEQKLFDSMHDSMKGGWTGSFNQLEEYLAKA